MLVPQDKVKNTESYVNGLMKVMELPYIIEDYNRKDVWWGSLPGIFRANVMPPLTGFSGLQGLMFHAEATQEATQEKEVIDFVPTGSLPAEEGLSQLQPEFRADNGRQIAG